MSDLSCKIYGCDYTAGETDCTKFSMPLVDKENLLPQDGNDNIALPSLGSFGSVNGEDFGAENSARCADAVADNVAHSLPSLLSQPEGLITDSSAEEGFVMGGFLHNSPPSILADTASFQISFNGSSKEFACASLQDLAPGEVRSRVCEAFGLPPRQDRAPLVLRHQGEGFIMPFGPALPAGVNFDLVCVDGPAAPPCRPGQPADAAAGPAGVQAVWVQEPPHGAAVWLHAKVPKSGSGIAKSCLRHVFAPAPAIQLLGGCGGDPEGLLATAKVSLFNSGMRDVTDLLDCGEPVVTRGADGRPTLSWGRMAVLDVCRPVAGVADALSAAELRSKRGARGWFHLAVALEGLPTLWLRGAEGGGLARIVVKDERLALLGARSWRRLGLGPFGDHARCTPSHTGPDGRRLCRCADDQRCAAAAAAVKGEPIDRGL